MHKQYNHKAIFMAEAAPVFEVGRPYNREAVAAEWRRLDELELAQELAQERAGRQKFLQRVGPAKAAELERTAEHVRRELANVREQTAKQAEHQRRMARIRLRIAEDQADERAIVRLKSQGVPETDRRIVILRLALNARKFEAEVKS